MSQLLRKVFIDDELTMFTSNDDLHYLTKFNTYEASEPSSEWLIEHNLKSSDIITQVMVKDEVEGYINIQPISITHNNRSTKIKFSSPHKGYALLVSRVSD